MKGVFGLLLALSTVTPDDEQTKAMTTNIERLSGASAGKCRLI
jgi:hypothetical protein